jgi:hypothetical protein
MAETSFKNKCLALEKHFRMWGTGENAGVRFSDGVLHELAHLVCLGVTVEEVVVTPVHDLERFVDAQIKARAVDPDRDECRTIAACVHAYRQTRMMKNTSKYVRASLRAARDLSEHPAKMPARVKQDLQTKASKKRGEALVRMVHDLYEKIRE